MESGHSLLFNRECNTMFRRDLFRIRPAIQSTGMNVVNSHSIQLILFEIVVWLHSRLLNGVARS